MTDLDALTLAEYAVNPALTGFSRVPVPWWHARAAGINSWAQAVKRAREQLQEGGIDDLVQS